ncbi:MAG: fimbria/pilus periplasmic chaperone [Hyphomicrobium sp.]
MSLRRNLIVSVAIAFLAPAASAMTVSPMQVEMSAIGTRSHAQVSVVNTSDIPMPVEAVIERMTLDENGKPKSQKTGEQFLIMPPQAMIPPGATQNFRVQWLGDPLMAQSETFLLYVNQIPVKVAAGKSAVQVVMSMGVMINVAPAQGVPELKVVATGVAESRSGKRQPTITVENVSKVHALFPEATIQLSSGTWTSTLTPRDTGDSIGIGLVQPGKRRKFVLPVELPAGVSNVKASVAMAAKRR